MRVIPKTAKVKVEFFRNISIPDIIIFLIGLGLEILIVLTDIELFAKIMIMVVVFCPFAAMYFPLDGQRFYLFLAHFIQYIFSMKTFSDKYSTSATNIDYFIPFKKFEGKYIYYKDYKASVLEISPREFNLLSEFRQNQIIDDYFGRIIRSINGKTRASIVKIDRKLYFDTYAKQEDLKRDALKKQEEVGELTKSELFTRETVVDDRIRLYNRMSEDKRIEKPFYYLVVYDENEGVIDEILNNAVSSFEDAGMKSKILTDRELGVFIKYTYTNNFNERDAKELAEEEFYNWVIPHEVKFNMNSTLIDGEECFTYTIRNFPLA